MRKTSEVQDMTPPKPTVNSGWIFLRRGLAGMLAALLLLPVAANAVDTICAKVKIEIKQELTLERQGFDAMMKINNGLTTTSLDSVGVNVNFKDEAGNAIRATSDPTDTTASFFIRIDSMTGITNVAGTGVVAPATTAEIHWLIIPAPGSGGTVPSGKLYYIGATLNYSVAGKAEQIDVSPDFVYVKPMPLLMLDYFMTKDVWGDDPLTLVVEPSEPYTLGVRVKNNGAATATNVKIDSAQPKIVDNQQGLLVNFAILGSYVNDQAATSSLLIPFGDIAPATAANGRWIMTSSLAGHFADFAVSFTHADSLGGALTSLMQATNPHYLIRDVKVDMPGRDNIRDFLALDGNVLRVYESSGLDTLVADQSAASVLTTSGSVAGGDALLSLSTPVTAGPMYVQLPDPYSGSKAVGRITRSDGKVMPTENVWFSKKRDSNNVLQYYFNLFDSNTTGIYNTSFTSAVVLAHPPVIQLVPDSTIVEGNQLTFQVTATDPDGTVPLLSSTTLLPVGATFITSVGANNVVTGVFSWKPAKGQAGKYPITFSATDGVLKTATATNVIVTTPIVPAGPDVPLIATPQVGVEVNVLAPSLAVAPSGNVLDTAQSYHIQVFSDVGMQSMVAEKLSLPRSTTANSVWALPVTLADNTMYFWRVRASDGTTFSSWSVGRFFVNTANDAPTAPVIASPMDNGTVSVTTPVLSVTNSTDPEGDVVVYGFEVFGDRLLTQKIAEVSNLVAGAPDFSNGSTSWVVTPALSNTTLYFWRASATDVHGAKTVSAMGNFLVDTTKPSPAAPALLAPAVGSVSATNFVDLTVANSARPSGVTLSYFFEIDRSQTFSSPSIIRSGAVLEGAGNTLFSITGLVENAHYYWRAKSSDGLTDSLWTYGDFIVDAFNDPPSVPGSINPGSAAWVTTTTPLFTFAPSTDPEGDAIAYRIEIYSDANLSMKVIDRLTSNLSWLTDIQLTDDTRYYWRVRAEDMRGGLSAWSPTSTFLVRVGSSGSMLPLMAVTSPMTVVDVLAVSAATPNVSVNISWEIDDPLGNSRVALYYDVDRLNANGTRIIDGLIQNPASRLGSYNWDVSTLAPGTYYIYALVSNSAGTVTRYAPGSFVVPVSTPRGVIALTPITALQTTESGGLAKFSVVLGNSPKADVVISLSTSMPTEGLLDLQQLIFTTANWKTPQVVTVIGQPDCISDGDVGYQVTTAKAVSNDVDYNGLKGADLSLVNLGSTAGCPSNNPPVVNAGSVQKVDAGSTVSLTGGATDADGAIASYAWVQTAGPTVTLADAAKAYTTFVAPSPKVETTLIFKLTATDNLGATGSATVNVVVKATPNLAPTANAGLAQTVISGASVILAGVGADSDGTIASFAWTQIAGPQISLIGGNTANASFVAPMVASNTVIGFSLTVTDNLGATATSTVAITVLPNQAPVANAGTNQIVFENSVVTLSGYGTDSDGSIANYAWTQTAGPTVALSNANLAVASFIAPTAALDTLLTFALTVTDNQGATGTATVNVTVKHINLPPVIIVGVAQTVLENTVVTLSGTATDGDGSIANYSWTQVSGPTVALTNANAATANFTAPPVATDTVMTFNLTVADNLGATNTVTVSVTAKHANLAPTANVGIDQVVNESMPVTLTGSGTDSDGTIASYVWTQTAGPNVVLTNANAAIATFIAPVAAIDTVLTFKLTVTDDVGANGSVTTNITIKHVNLAPSVNAGVAQAVNESTVVTLNGTATDSDGTIASYAWTQVAGPSVTLTNANALTASFVAPVTLVDAVVSFKLTVIDNVGASTSATTNVTVKHVNVLPTANAGVAQIVNESTTVTLIGSGTDSDGTIASYIWTQVAGPSLTLTNANAATASFIAPATLVDAVLSFKLTVTDNVGASTSATTNVTVKHVNVVSSTINLTSPVANSAYTQWSNVSLTADAVSATGSIAKVDFYANDGTTNALIGTDTYPPFNMTWNTGTGGNYQITAVATDNLGVQTTSLASSIKVVVAPTISLISPANNAVAQAPGSFTFTANVQTLGSIAQVDFYNGTTLLGSAMSAPYSYNWSNIAAGSYTLSAKAIDSMGQSGTSNYLNVIVATPPYVSLSSPLSNTSVVAPGSLTLTAQAWGMSSGLSSVSFYNGSVLLGTSTSAPYSYTWSNIAAGNYSLTAVATDANNLSSTSSVVNVAVTVTSQPPTINLTSPVANSAYTQWSNVSLTADAVSATGSIAKVDFYANDGTTNALIGTDTYPPFNMTWNTGTGGNYQITAVATDNLGVQTTSLASSIKVVVAPTISLISPANNAVAQAPGSFTFTANVQTLGSIAQVDFYNGTTLLGSAMSAPYSYNWSNIAAGSYTLSAKAIDSMGQSGTSNYLNVIVATPPYVSLSSPLSNTSVVAPGSLTLTAQAWGMSSGLSSVSFYNGSVLLGTSTSAPYSYTWSNIAAGNYSLTAVATDANNLSSTSSVVNVAVQ